MTLRINRRSLLRGAGVSLAMPWMECMGAKQSNANGELPRRLACVFFPNGVSLPPENHPHHEQWNWFPINEGRDYQFTNTLASLERFRPDLSILGGLSHPSGRNLPGHTVSDVFLTGSEIGSTIYTNSISLDQMVATRTGAQTRMDALILSTTGGIGQTGRTNTLSFTAEGQPIPAEDNLRHAFNMMFGDSAESAKAARKTLARQKSMLDLVLDDAKALDRQLGKTDQRKLDQYLSSVRSLELRVERSERWLDVPKIKVDEGQVKLEADRDMPLDYIRAMYDLMYLAFSTDTTRVGTYLIGTEGGGQLSDVFPHAMGLPTIHELSHNTNKSDDGYKNWAIWDQFLAEQLAYFLGRLKDTPEGDGNMLDRTLVYHGCSTSTTHRARNYPILLAGGGDLGLKHGQYIQFDEEQNRLADLYLTMLHTLDIQVESFADSQQTLSRLRA